MVDRTAFILEMFLNIASFSIFNGYKAEALIQHYPSLERILFCQSDELRDHFNLNQEQIHLLHLVRDVVINILEKRVLTGSTVQVSELMDLVRFHLSFLEDEGMYVFMFCAQKKFIGHEVLSRGDNRSVQFSLRVLTKLVLERKAEHLLLAHNHPNGYARPSIQDIALTDKVVSLLAQLNIHLLDHFIVSNDRIYSILQKRIIRQQYKSIENS